MAASGTSASSAALPAGVARRLENVDLNPNRIAEFFQHLADQNTASTRKLLVKIDAVAELGRLGLNEHLSSQRSNGVRAMVDRIREEAASRA